MYIPIPFGLKARYIKIISPPKENESAKKISTRFMYVLILHFPKVIKIINIATAKSVRIFNPNGSTGSRAVRLKSPPTILPIITLKYFIFEPMIFFVASVKNNL